MNTIVEVEEGESPAMQPFEHTPKFGAAALHALGPILSLIRNVVLLVTSALAACVACLTLRLASKLICR